MTRCGHYKARAYSHTQKATKMSGEETRAFLLLKMKDMKVWVECPYAGGGAKTHLLVERNIRYAEYAHSYLRQNGISHLVIPTLLYSRLPRKSLVTVLDKTNQSQSEKFHITRPLFWTPYDTWRDQADYVVFFTDLGSTPGMEQAWETTDETKRIKMRIPDLCESLNNLLVTPEGGDAIDVILLDSCTPSRDDIKYKLNFFSI